MDDFEKLYRKYAPAVKKFIISLGADYDLSDDITADTFLKILKNAKSYDENVNMFTYICTIAKNTYFDYIKKKSNHNLELNEELTIFDLKQSPQFLMEEKADKLMLYKNLMRLDYPYKDVIYFRIFADLSFKEIGELFSMSENWARVTFYRGKVKLKEMIENEI